MSLVRVPTRVFAICAVFLCAFASGVAAQELKLKRVMLSTGGVAYYEHEAVVEGDAELSLNLRLDQIDDVLKSLVVYDGVGRVGAIRLPGRDALRQIFRDLPFEPGDLTSPVALLNAQRGAELVAAGARELRGRLIGVQAETVALPNQQGTITRHRVSLMTGAGIQQFVLEEADSVRFFDDAIQGQLDTALAAVAAHRVRDRRTLRVEVKGDGRRAVRVGYVVAAPLWKSSYRMILDEAGDTGRLQGWAVVENMSGHDWDDVELTLLSGNPVTFRQALYTAYYVHRPEVPVEVLGRVLPRPDSGAVSLEGDFRGRAQLRRQRMEESELADMDMLERRAVMSKSAIVAGVASELMAAEPMAPMAAPAMAAARADAATQVVFRLTEPVSVASGQSVVVPIVDVAVPASRVALYQQITHALHPLASVRLVNDTGTGLPPGVLTLYERGADGAVAYVGDARLSSLPAGEERLLGFALDQKTRVDREVHSTRSIVKGAISRGTFRLTVRQRQTTEYRLKGPAGEARELLIEHPRLAGWDLEEPDPKAATLTESHYRLPVSLKAGEEKLLQVVLGRPVVERHGLVDMTRDQFRVYAASQELAPELRRAFRRLAELRAEVERFRLVMAELQQRRDKIFQDQERIRRNLNSVPRDGDLHRRYVDKLTDQEDFLDRLMGDVEDTQQALNGAEAKLAQTIQNMDI